jgi:hypothetical protein
MANTYTLLETITVGAAGASSVTFNSIPQTGYTDLVIKASARSGGGSPTWLYVTFNGSASTYNNKVLQGSGSAASSSDVSAVARLFTGAMTDTGQTANTFANAEIYIPNYTSSNTKSASSDGVQENNATAATMGMWAGQWTGTAAITSIEIKPQNLNTFAQYSTFSLYGVSALGTTPTKAPKATGGSIIQTDGTYWYHAFLSSGTFTPATALSCDVLVVAGGGGGGSGVYSAGGGGGAGGIFYATSQSISASAQTITVGGGGAGGVYPTAQNGTNGSNSSFASLTAGVAGGGGGTGATVGNNGGSGGGGGAGTTIAGGSSTQTGTGGTGYGFAGGTATAGTAAAGGGGSGAVGANGASLLAGDGGAGRNTWSSWLSTTGLGVSGFIAGGGGGANGYSTTAAGGSGGGGAGAGYNVTAPVAGTANTGSGGGGGGGTSAPTGSGAAGNSGLVIIRYLAA